MTGGKKISGIKLHVGVDVLGLPHALVVTTADVGDRNGAKEMVKAHASNLSSVAAILGDGGYTGENLAGAVFRMTGAEVKIAKRNELHKFAVIPKRWVVERSFAWLDNYRRLWKNCERKLDTALQMTTLAFVALLLKRWRC